MQNFRKFRGLSCFEFLINGKEKLAKHFCIDHGLWHTNSDNISTATTKSEGFFLSKALYTIKAQSEKK